MLIREQWEVDSRITLLLQGTAQKDAPPLSSSISLENKMHNELYEKAQEALNKLFSDTSVPQETMKKDLESLVDKIQTMIESLDET